MVEEAQNDSAGIATPWLANDQIPLTDHARQRCAQRGIPHEAVLLSCEYGRLLRTAGASFYFLGRRETELARAIGVNHRILDRSRGLVVLLAEDGSVITAYRNQCALAEIRRKQPMNRNGRARSD